MKTIQRKLQEALNYITTQAAEQLKLHKFGHHRAGKDKRPQKDTKHDK